MNAPDDFAAAVKDWPNIRADIAFLRSLRNLRALTDIGDVNLQSKNKGSNAVLDLRGLTPSGAPPVPSELPSQAGQSGKFLSTDGISPLWATPPQPSDYTQLRRVATLSVASATTTFIPFDTADVNASGVWDVSDPTKLTIPAGQGGLWQGFIWLFWAANANGQRQCGIRLNGSTFLFAETRMPLPADGTSVLISFIRRFSAADYIEWYGYQASGGNLDLISQQMTFLRLGN